MVGIREAQEMAWQTIETAPKDGTGIIAWSDEWAGPMSVIWMDSRGGSWRIHGCSSLELGAHGQPTHWMPLPLPPQDSLPELADAT